MNTSYIFASPITKSPKYPKNQVTTTKRRWKILFRFNVLLDDAGKEEVEEKKKKKEEKEKKDALVIVQLAWVAKKGHSSARSCE